MNGVKEAALEINGIPLRVAVVHGTDNARAFIEDVYKRQLLGLDTHINLSGVCRIEFVYSINIDLST